MQQTIARKIDIGRLYIVPVFSLFLFLIIRRVMTEAGRLSGATNHELLSIAYQILLVCFYILIIGLYLFRGPAISSSRSLPANVIAVYALACLGRSISIIPQARRLVRTGPYRFIRHPLYAGELIGVFGVVLAGMSIAALPVYLLLVLMQAYRAKQEERLLGEVFPEYREYSQVTARFVPGIY